MTRSKNLLGLISLLLFLPSAFAGPPKEFDSGIKDGKDQGRDRIAPGWHMRTNIKVQDDGRIIGTTTLWNANFNGFVGGAVILLKDKDGNVIWPPAGEAGKAVMEKGIGGTEESVVGKWDLTYPKELFPKIAGAEFVHMNVGRNPAKLAETLEGYLKAGKKAAEAAKGLYDLFK